MANMEAEVWNLVNHLLTRTANQSATTELEKIRRAYPSSVLMTQNVVGQFASFLRCLDEKCQHTLNARILKDIAVWVEQIWHYSPNCLRVCSADSDEGLLTVCRVALQEAWFSDSRSSFQCVLTPDQDLRPVIYISPGAPPHLRRWLSLNLCCSGLLLVSLPSSHTDELPTIDVSAFSKLVENDVKLGRKPLMLIAYSGGTYYGSSDCLSALSAICRRHKIWLHVEGLSILRFALLTKPPIDQASHIAINSLNLDFSMCVGICQPVNVVVLRSTLPESILLYLNVFPLSTTAAVSSASSAQDSRGCLDEGAPATLSIPRTPSSLPEAILAWISLRLQDGHAGGVGARMRHATELTRYMSSALQKLQDIYVLAKPESVTTPDVSPSQSAPSNEDTFLTIMDEFTGRCPVLLFRYNHLSRRKPTEQSTVTSKSTHLSRSVTESPPVLLPTRSRCKSGGSFAKQRVSQEARFLNGLNEWLVSALQFEHPGMGLKICSVDGNNACVRFSPLSAVSLMSIKEADIDAFVQNVATSCMIMKCTLEHRAAFRSLVNSTPGLYYFHLLDWAGLGAAFYVPHTYRCLFPPKTGVSPQPRVEESTAADGAGLMETEQREEGEEEDGVEGVNGSHNRAVLAALLRLPPNAAQAIADVNRDLISRLRNHDFAFSSFRINFRPAAMVDEAINLAPTGGSNAIARALDPLASPPPLPASRNSRAAGGGGGGGGESLPASDGFSPLPAARDSVPPIVTTGLSCLRFGLITPGTDMSEMLELVLQVASVVEEDSNYVNNLSEIVKRGIEEATNQLKVEQEKKLREEGMLRQVPYLDRLVNWWYPPTDAQIPGRALNLSIGELSSTQPLLRQRSSTVSLHQQQATSSVEKQPGDSEVASSNHSSTAWQWFPFGRKTEHIAEATAQAISPPSDGLSNGNGSTSLSANSDRGTVPAPKPISTPMG
uniref:Pyridoxal-dependent decarboxylase domain-containing protein 1 n=1 Tax=Schistocephalus solidus TaxID=70667 RepID=A0A0X3Q7N7_SCHSO